MPAKHAPESPASFYWSLARAGIGALAALGLVVAIVLVAVGSGGDEPKAAGTSTPTGRRSQPPATGSVTPSPTATTPDTPAPPVARARLVIDVLNGKGTTGLAADVQGRMAGEGYERVEVGNPDRLYDRTTIYYREGFRREAERLLADLPELLRVRPASPDLPVLRDRARLIVMLGDDFEG